MLVLERKPEEAIIIDTGKERITIKVMNIRGDKVRLGFVAPGYVTVHREEVQKLVDKQRVF